MKLAEIKEAMRLEDIRNKLRVDIEQNLIDGITVISKTRYVDSKTLKPKVKCIIEFEYIVELNQDSKSIMTADEAYIIIGKTISSEAAKINCTNNI